MLSLRRFPDDVEALATEWRGSVVSSDDWIVAGTPGATASGAYFVRSGDLFGIAKPHEADLMTSGKPQAALEKIAADLAFDLQLPVPPAVLWRRPDGGGRVERNVSISVRAFERATPWSVARKAARAQLNRWEKDLVAAASAMVPFDTLAG